MTAEGVDTLQKWCSKTDGKHVSTLIGMTWTETKKPHSGVFWNSSMLSDVALPDAPAVMQHQSSERVASWHRVEVKVFPLVLVEQLKIVSMMMHPKFSPNKPC